ncbi:TatD family hydrolase, partial [Lysinibacillus sp. D4A1_S13]
RGKRNEASYVKYVAEQLAALKGLTYEEIASITTENAKKLFRMN